MLPRSALQATEPIGNYLSQLLVIVFGPQQLQQAKTASHWLANKAEANMPHILPGTAMRQAPAAMATADTLLCFHPCSHPGQSTLQAQQGSRLFSKFQAPPHLLISCQVTWLHSHPEGFRAPNPPNSKPFSRRLIRRGNKSWTTVGPNNILAISPRGAKTHRSAQKHCGPYER